MIVEARRPRSTAASWAWLLAIASVAAGCGALPAHQPRDTVPPLVPTPFPAGDPNGALPYLVRDIKPGSASSSPSAFVAFAGKLYFATDDESDGIELWATDGTEGGTNRVVNINPGPADSSPHDPAVFAGTLYFGATSALDGGDELYRSEGDAGSTGLLLDIAPGPGSSHPSDLVVTGGRLFFVADDGTHGSELWVSNGTAAGTVMVKDVNPGPASGVLRGRPSLYAAGNHVYFAADDGQHGTELWRSDGTAEGTLMVKDANPGPGSSIAAFNATVVGDLLFFQADDGVEPLQLFRSDGTARGTYSLGLRSSGKGAASRGAFLFESLDDLALWRSDGTRQGTARVSDVDPTHIVDVDGTVFFASETVGAEGLWKSDGTPPGTVLVRDFRAEGSAPSGLGGYRGRTYFALSDPYLGTELWTTDGTPNGTLRVADIAPGAASSLGGTYDVADLFFGFGDRIYFLADDGHSGQELWAYRPPK